MNISKSERERSILELVYDKKAFSSIQKQESPDFVLCRRGTCFGVEVTEWYESESEARVQNKPNYLTDLFAGGEHIHRDDRRALNVVAVEIHDAEGVEIASDVPAIIREQRPLQEHFSELASVVRRKNELIEGYGAESLSHVNLALLDRTDRRLTKTDEYESTDLFVPELRAAISETGFREVFLVTMLGDGVRRVIPLKMVMLASSFSIFIRAIEAYAPTTDVRNIRGIIASFVSHARQDGIEAHLVDAGAPNPGAFWGNAAITFEVGGGMRVLYLNDHGRWPVIEREPLKGLASAEFRTHYEKFSSEASFVSALALPVVVDTYIGMEPSPKRRDGA